MKKIGIIIGSLRKGSYNRSVARYAASLFPDKFTPVFVDLQGIDIFNEDLEENPPASWTTFRASLRDLDAFLFVTAEYNRSMPGVLKNALDVGSRPYGESVWGGKPAGIISASPGGIGGFGSNHHLRQVLTFLDVYTMQQPEAYLGHIASSLDENGEVASEDLKSLLKNYVDAFCSWVERCGD